MEKLQVKEQLVKTVVKSGNGGAVWVPKNWLGEEVVVILPDKPKQNYKEKIIRLLEPYLKDIIAVFIYGSYARHEQTKESDLDAMVLTNKDIIINIKQANLELSVFKIDRFKSAIKKYPVMYCQMVQEAEPLVNAHALEELKSIKIDIENFKAYINETKEHIKSNEELIALDKLEGVYVRSYSVLYSAILRLRGIFIIKCILNKRIFSNKSFKKFLLREKLTNLEFKLCYEIYRLISNNKNIKNIKIEISTVEKLLNMLKSQSNLLESKLYGK